MKRKVCALSLVILLALTACGQATEAEWPIGETDWLEDDPPSFWENEPDPPVYALLPEYPERVREYLRETLLGSMLVRVSREGEIEQFPLAGMNYSHGRLSPSGRQMLVRVDQDAQGDGQVSGYAVLDLPTDPIARHYYAGVQWGHQTHLFLDDGLIGFASGGVIGGQEDVWQMVKLFDGHYNPLNVPFEVPAGEDILVVGIGYDRANAHYALAYVASVEDENDKFGWNDFLPNRLVIAVFDQAGGLVREHTLPKSYLSPFEPHTVNANNPIVTPGGQVIVRVVHSVERTAHLRAISPNGDVQELPWTGLRQSEDGNHAFAIDDTLTPYILDLTGSEVVARQFPFVSMQTYGMFQSQDVPIIHTEHFGGLIPFNAAIRGDHVFLLAEGFAQPLESDQAWRYNFHALFYWDMAGDTPTLLEIFPGHGFTSLAGVCKEGYAYVLIRGVYGDVHEDMLRMVHDLIGQE